MHAPWGQRCTTSPAVRSRRQQCRLPVQLEYLPQMLLAELSSQSCLGQHSPCLHAPHPHLRMTLSIAQLVYCNSGTQKLCCVTPAMSPILTRAWSLATDKMLSCLQAHLILVDCLHGWLPATEIDAVEQGQQAIPSLKSGSLSAGAATGSLSALKGSVSSRS